MRYFFILLFFVNTLLAMSSEQIEKQLSSQARAEVFLQNKIEGGYYKDAEEFFKEAIKKYDQNSELLRWGGELYLQTNRLEEAKKYFVESLALDPSNEICSMKIKQIADQEDAQENKDVGKLIDMLWDKGLDFLMIFLAFLGGEIIGKRYNTCQHDTVHQIAEHYIHRTMLATSSRYRFQYLFKQYFSQKFFSFCFLLKFLIVTVITITLLITWLFIEFHYEITWFLESSLLTLDASAIEKHIYIFFILFFVLTLFIRAFIAYIQFPKEEKVAELVFVENLDRLLNDAAYIKLYEIFIFLFDKKHHIDENEINLLLDKYSQTMSSDFARFYKN